MLRPGDEVVAVPAIATEGRALYDAAVAQGIAGILARQRMSPYLPGMRSRLWRYVPATPGSIPAAEFRRSPRRRLRGGPGARAAQPPAARRRGLTGARSGRAQAYPARRAAAMNVRRPGRWP